MILGLGRTLATAGYYFRMIAQRDVGNFVRYGPKAPKWAERVLVDPSLVTLMTREFAGDAVSGLVLAGDWAKRAYPLGADVKYSSCRAHWDKGVPWPETGIYDYMLEQIAAKGSYDGCRTQHEIVQRYEYLDRVFEQVRREGRLRSRRELARGIAFRGLGDIRMHFGERHIIFGGAGVHRLAMAGSLELDVVPARVGVVHPGAIPNWRGQLR